VRFSVRLPTDRVHCGEEFASAAGVAEVAAAAERAGFDACFVTDHPFPVQRWLDGGGHHALDPFVALSFAAAATSRLRLQTHILVLPYRNPFLAAKAALSLDVLSGGRLTLGVAAGYLRGEFGALGADFESRNEVSDEAIRAMKLAWTQADLHFEGRGFRARGNTMLPRPVQRPHPPVWVGGNSRQAIRRAVDLGEGWVPFPNTRAMAPHTRTATIESRSDLAARIEMARSYARERGRTAPLDICFSLEGEGAPGGVPGDHLAAEVADLAALGVTWLAVGFAGETRAAYLEEIARFGERLARLR
jgi:probable F420-dependent oxidoreductase